MDTVLDYIFGDLICADRRLRALEKDVKKLTANRRRDSVRVLALTGMIMMLTALCSSNNSEITKLGDRIEELERKKGE